MKARVRVFLPTYRRNDLLPRALASLQTQTIADWVCEVHNDAPDDPEPERIVAELGDERFVFTQHETNLGGTATFNLFYDGAPEPFTSILEDDNWWEPRFLETMLGAADHYPEATIFWSNMRIWQELSDGSFADTGTCVRDIANRRDPQPMDFGTADQINGPLHSNGACLIRCRAGQSFKIPAVPQAVIEMFRERVFPYPLIYIPEPLVNFSRTLKSERSSDPTEWAVVQSLLAATFLKHVRPSDPELGNLLSIARARRPPETTTLLYAGLIDPACRRIWGFTTAQDWIVLLRGLVRRPGLAMRILGARARHSDWWDFLDRHTARQISIHGAR